MVTYTLPVKRPSCSLPTNNNLVTETSISNWYVGQVIFITGGTGFVGKALLEKLLRSCPNISQIYLLIRPKRGQAIDTRLKELIRNPVFDRIKEKTPEYLDKVKAIAGDVSHPNLGICEADRQILINSVNVAFHSAATVRFNESLKDAVILNTAGTKRVMKLCKEMKKLKSFVHVSTAYSNADKREVDEIVYDPPYDPDLIIKCVETLPIDTINIIAEKIQGKHPNTYTLTKAMAEYIVQQNSSEFPTAIVRPSIVTAAWKEPFRGWIDNISGITGIMLEIGRGTIRSIICEESYTIDVIPVDVLANTLVCAAWHNATQRSNTVRVYNCTSGQVNGISWRNFGRLTLKHSLTYPSKYVTWYPGFRFRTNRLVHYLLHWLLHIIPSAFLDVLLFCTRHKPIMLRICNKLATAARHGTFFAINQWNFKNETLGQMVTSVQRAEDSKEFLNCDMSPNSDFKWDDYVREYVKGIRKYVLKDDDSTLQNARTKLTRLLWIKRILQFTSLYIFLKNVYNI